MVLLSQVVGERLLPPALQHDRGILAPVAILDGTAKHDVADEGSRSGLGSRLKGIGPSETGDRGVKRCA
jgi:hypothetical protein